MPVDTGIQAPKQSGHPKGLYLLFTVEMWERFGYYGMRAILTLYMTAAVIMPAGQEGIAGLGYQEAEAAVIMGWFQGFVYLMPLLGGFLADKFLGRRLSITIGGVLMMLGYACLALVGGTTTFLAGLFLICIGNGFFKPNISTVVGGLYDPGDTRRDTAFTIFYMGINVGALIAPIICGSFRVDPALGYSYGFGAAAVGMFLGLVAYWVFGKKLLGNVGMKPENSKNKEKGDDSLSLKEVLAKAKETGLSVAKIERDRITVIFVLAIFVIAFWAGFDLAPTAITFFTENHINKDVGLFIFDTAYFQSLNPAMVVGFAPLFAILWTFLGRRGKEPNTPVKMALGIILAGIGFLFMYGAAAQVEGAAAGVVMASFWWVAITYVFHTFGELCLSPVGLSMITKLSPARYSSLMMGVWFLSVFLANIIAGYLVGVKDAMGGYTDFFLMLALVIIALGVILFAISGKLRKMMHGIG